MTQEEFLELMELDPVAAAEKILENDSIKDSDILDVIEHYGIEGQKWGVRNGPPYPLERKRMSASEKRAYKQEQKGKSSSELSKKDKARIVLQRSDELTNEELQQAIKRIKLEEELKNFTKTDRELGESVVKNSLQKAEGAIITTVATAAGLYLVKTVLNRYLGAKVPDIGTILTTVSKK